MATRGWEQVAPAEVLTRATAAPRRKYRNVKVEVDGIWFDSQAEANVWLQLADRERRTEIYGLRRQVPFPLKTPVSMQDGHTIIAVVAHYVADFVYHEAGTRHVVDVKRPATATPLYRLKRKWLLLQNAIEIEEVAG